MKVKELIEQLQQFDPEMRVMTTQTDPTDYNYKVDIKQVIEGDCIDDSGCYDEDGNEIDLPTFTEDDENWPKIKAVLIDIGDV